MQVRVCDHLSGGLACISPSGRWGHRPLALPLLARTVEVTTENTYQLIGSVVSDFLQNEIIENSGLVGVEPVHGPASPIQPQLIHAERLQM